MHFAGLLEIHAVSVAVTWLPRFGTPCLCKQPSPLRTGGFLLHADGQARLSFSSFTKGLQLHASFNNDGRVVCRKKKMGKVFTCAIKFPAIPARHLWQQPRCMDIACFVKKAEACLVFLCCTGPSPVPDFCVSQAFPC